MELTGRTYIFFAATLLLLAGTLQFYSQVQEENAAPGMVVTHATAAENCDKNAIKLSSARIGCQINNDDVRVLRMSNSRSLTGGGAKFVSSLN